MCSLQFSRGNSLDPNYGECPCRFGCVKQQTYFAGCCLMDKYEQSNNEIKNLSNVIHLLIQKRKEANFNYVTSLNLSPCLSNLSITESNHELTSYRNKLS